MANITVNVAAESGLIPQVWAQRILDHFLANLVLARLVVRDSQFSPAERGSVLNIRYLGRFTAQDKAPDTPIAPQTPVGGTTITVALDRYKAVDFIVEDVAQAQSDVNILDRYVEPAARALAEAVEQDLFALYTRLPTTIGQSGTDITAATIREARRVLNENKVPISDRFLVISPKDEVALLGDPTLATYFAMAGRGAVAEGSLGPLYGFTVYMSQLVPAVEETDGINTVISHKNLAFHREAFILATRPLPDPPAGSGVRAATVRDPDTGLIIRVLYSYDIAHRGVRVGADILYGVAVLRPQAGVVVLS